LKKSIQSFITVSLFLVTNTFASNNLNVIDTDIKSMILEVIKRNPNLIFDRKQNDLVDSQVILEYSKFDPSFIFNYSYQNIYTPNTVSSKVSSGYLDSSKEVIDSAEIGLSGLVPYLGTQWSTSLSLMKQKSNVTDYYAEYDSEYQNSFKFNIVQPLLKGFGEYGVMGNINIIKVEKNIYNKTYRKNIMDMMGSVIQTYWKYYSALEIKKSYENSVALNKKIIDLLEQKVNAGDIAYTEVLEVKSSTYVREAELKKMNIEIQKYKNDFFTLLNISSSSNIDFNLLDVHIFNESDISLNTEDYYNKAIKMWPEYAIAEEKYKKEQLQYKVTQNYVKPQLDLSFGASTSTLDSEKDYSFYDNEHYSWNIGLQLNVPIFNTQSENALKIARIKEHQVGLELSTLKNGLYNAIHSKLQSYKNLKEQVEFYKNGLKLKEDLLAFTRKGFEFGDKSIRDVIEQEDDMINYKVKYFNSIIDFKLAKASLDKATGELFNKYLNDTLIDSIGNINIQTSITKENFGVLD
jgi:outer membrane protein TolC